MIETYTQASDAARDLMTQAAQGNPNAVNAIAAMSNRTAIDALTAELKRTNDLLAQDKPAARPRRATKADA